MVHLDDDELIRPLPPPGDERRECVDPDGFTIGTFILAAVSAGAGVFSAYTAYTKADRERKAEENKRKAVVHRWEAELLELRDILTELRGFLEQSGSLTANDPEAPLRPFTSRLLLDPKDFQKCRRVLNKLTAKTQKLHEATFRLIELVSSPRHQAYLGEKIRAVEGQLQRLYRMESLSDSLKTADETTASLLKTAEFLRNDLI